MRSTWMKSNNNGNWGYLITVISLEIRGLLRNPSRPSKRNWINKDGSAGTSCKNSSSSSWWTWMIESSRWVDEIEAYCYVEWGRFGSKISEEIEGGQGKGIEGADEEEPELDG